MSCRMPSRVCSNSRRSASAGSGVRSTISGTAPGPQMGQPSSFRFFQWISSTEPWYVLPLPVTLYTIHQPARGIAPTLEHAGRVGQSLGNRVTSLSARALPPTFLRQPFARCNPTPPRFHAPARHGPTVGATALQAGRRVSLVRLVKLRQQSGARRRTPLGILLLEVFLRARLHALLLRLGPAVAAPGAVALGLLLRLLLLQEGHHTSRPAPAPWASAASSRSPSSPALAPSKAHGRPRGVGAWASRSPLGGFSPPRYYPLAGGGVMSAPTDTRCRRGRKLPASASITCLRRRLPV